MQRTSKFSLSTFAVYDRYIFVGLTGHDLFKTVFIFQQLTL